MQIKLDDRLTCYLLCNITYITNCLQKSFCTTLFLLDMSPCSPVVCFIRSFNYDNPQKALVLKTYLHLSPANLADV